MKVRDALVALSYYDPDDVLLVANEHGDLVPVGGFNFFEAGKFEIRPEEED